MCRLIVGRLVLVLIAGALLTTAVAVTTDRDTLTAWVSGSGRNDTGKASPAVLLADGFGWGRARNDTARSGARW